MPCSHGSLQGAFDGSRPSMLCIAVAREQLSNQHPHALPCTIVSLVDMVLGLARHACSHTARKMHTSRGDITLQPGPVRGSRAGRAASHGVRQGAQDCTAGPVPHASTGGGGLICTNGIAADGCAGEFAVFQSVPNPQNPLNVPSVACLMLHPAHLPFVQETVEAVATALSSLCGGVPVMPLSAGDSDDGQVEAACVALVCHGACAADAVRTRTR